MSTSIVSSVAFPGNTASESDKIKDAIVGSGIPSMAHVRAITPAIPVVIEQTSALVIGGGAANDSYLLSIIILLNGTAVTATVAGFEDEDGDAKSIVFTGSTTADVAINLGAGLINTKGALTVTASVADKVIVNYWPVV